MDSMSDKYSKVRKQVFSTPVDLDPKLIEFVDGTDSHNFLKNPAGQNVYLYLTLFIKRLSEYYFSKKIHELKILDWGCGKGQVTYLLRRLGATPISCDVQSGMSDSSFAQERPILDKVGIVVEPLFHEYALPFESNSMDIILSFGVLEHVPNDFESLKEINRLLKPKGLFFCFNLPYIFSWTQRLAYIRGNYYHDRLYSKSHVFELLKKTGFNLLDFWHRQLFPKNNVRYPYYQLFELLDQFFTNRTPLRYLATNIEFVASKHDFE